MTNVSNSLSGYATTTSVTDISNSLSGYATDQELLNVSNSLSGYATDQELLDVSNSLSGYATDQELLDVSNSLSGYATTTMIDELSAVISGISTSAEISGGYVISVNGISGELNIPYAISGDLVNLENSLSGYTTDEEFTNLSNSLSGYATTTMIDELSAAISGFSPSAEIAGGYVISVNGLSGELNIPYATSSDLLNVSNSLSGYSLDNHTHEISAITNLQTTINTLSSDILSANININRLRPGEFSKKIDMKVAGSTLIYTVSPSGVSSDDAIFIDDVTFFLIDNDNIALTGAPTVAIGTGTDATSANILPESLLDLTNKYDRDVYENIAIKTAITSDASEPNIYITVKTGSTDSKCDVVAIIGASIIDMNSY